MKTLEQLLEERTLINDDYQNLLKSIANNSQFIYYYFIKELIKTQKKLSESIPDLTIQLVSSLDYVNIDFCFQDVKYQKKLFLQFKGSSDWDTLIKLKDLYDFKPETKKFLNTQFYKIKKLSENFIYTNRDLVPLYKEFPLEDLKIEGGQIIFENLNSSVGSGLVNFKKYEDYILLIEQHKELKKIPKAKSNTKIKI